MSAKQTATRVLAFDPGFERLGAAVLEKESNKQKLIHSECVRTSATLPFPERLKILGDEARVLIKKYLPDVVALEDVYFAKNAKTAMHVAEVRGMLMYLAASANIQVLQYTPLQVKVATTGHGRSDKKSVAFMVGRLVSLPERKRLDDEVDAIAVGITCLASFR